MGVVAGSRMSGKSLNVTERLLTYPGVVATASNPGSLQSLMREAPLETDHSPTSEQKRAALEAVLLSQTFARADQLKSFLKYVCEMEMAGRGHELTEYLIGIEALGRPANYSPGDDSVVRTRAFAIRKKLQEFYEQEQPGAPLRIELLKGSYCPRFIEGPASQKANGREASAERLALPSIESAATHEESAAAEDAGRREWKGGWLLPFGAGVVLTALLAGGCTSTREREIAALQADDGLLQFQLLPRHLGRIEVSVQSGSEGISVRVAAENAAAQSILATAQMRLVDDLRSNGVRLAATDIGMQAEGWAQDRRDQDRPHADQRWNFVETGHPADPLPVRARRARTDRLA